jgi:hypothetical protein
MKIALIGLTGSGKSTCFSALTGLAEAPGAGSDRLGVVPVPEPRLDRLEVIYSARRQVQAEITLADTPALDETAGPEAIEKQLGRLTQEAEAFVLVLRCFGDLDHRGEALDPPAELENLLLELNLADLGLVERRLQRMQQDTRRSQSGHEERLLRELQTHLTAGKRAAEFFADPEHQKTLGGYSLLTKIPLLVLCNVADNDLEGEGAAGVREACQSLSLPCLHFCAQLEAEIAQLPPAEQEGFLQDYGLENTARQRLIRAAYDTLGLITFLTAGEKETRAWPIAQGLTAAQAAGKIHTDIEKGFIRAEIVAFTALDQYGSLAECRKHGLVRLEGRDYLMKDGDVADFRFSI